MAQLAAPPPPLGDELLISSPVISGQLGVSVADAQEPEAQLLGNLKTGLEENKLTADVSLNREDLSSHRETAVPVIKKSWVKVVQKHVFSQQKFVVSEVNGQEKVIVPKEVFLGAKPLWEDFLIGRFLSTKAPHVGKIHMIVNKIWRLGDKTSLIDVYEVNASTVKFRIRNESMRHRILNRGMWNIMDIPMVVSKWTPFGDEEQPAMKSIPLWITLTNVPPTLFTDKGLEFLASAVGKPLRLHPKTETCVTFDEAQILVQADLTKDLPKEFIFTGEEEGELDTVIRYSYPWLPPRCSCCQKWGHLYNSCLAALTSENKSLKETPISEENQKETENADPQVSASLPEIVVVTTADCVPAEETKEVSMVSENDASETLVITENENDKSWITPPGSRRSPNKRQENLKFGEVSLLSNPYSALSGKDGLAEETTEEYDGNDTDQITEITSTVNENLFNLTKPRGTKAELPLRRSLPRGTKTAPKSVSNLLTLSARDLPKDQSRRVPPKHL